HSADQLRATLLAAPSVAYSDSASGRYVSSTLFHTLGIDDAMQSKAQMVERIPVASEVAKGRYAIGFQQVSELLPVPGVTFVGELPDNLQYITRFAGAVTISADHPQEGKALTRFAGAVTISADHPQEGKALLTYLASPAAQETIHATGMRSVAAAAPVSQKDTVQ
ncbi:substrate-binding domain-containing protein, partial [Klebsiella pneumoniae]|nr:substrate-binding domain-containing protein [Klebsiella pneumoniae]